MTTPPPIRGGQGRTRESVEADAKTLGILILTAIVLIVLLLGTAHLTT